METITENNQSRISSLDKAYEEYRQKCVKNGLGIDNDDEITKKIIKGDITPEQLETIEGKILPEEQFKAYYYPKELSGKTISKILFTNHISLRNNILVLPSSDYRFYGATYAIQTLSDGGVLFSNGDGVHLIKKQLDRKYVLEKDYLGKDMRGVTAFQILPNGIVTGDSSGKICLFVSQPDGTYKREILNERGAPISSLQFLPDEKIIVGGAEGVYLLTPESDGRYIQKRIGEFNGSAINTIQVLLDGRIVAAGENRKIYLLIPRRGGDYRKKIIYQGVLQAGVKRNPIAALQVLADKRIIIADNDDLWLYKLHTDEEYERKSLLDCRLPIYSFQLLPDGSIITGCGVIVKWS